MTTLRFFYNGIKGTDGKLQTCSYSDGQLVSYPTGTITIYKRGYSGIELTACFALAVFVQASIAILKAWRLTV